MTSHSVLERFVGEPSTFVRDYWGKQVLYRPSSANGRVSFDDVITLDEIDQLIGSTQPHYPDINLVKDGMQIDPSQFASLPDPRRGGARVIDPARVYDYFHQGATIQMQGAHFRHRGLGALCRGLEIELTVPVQANMYITPPRSRGLSLHADSHDVLVLQVFGTKHWEIFERIPAGADLDDLPGDPRLCLETDLTSGDVLYVPRGVPHRVASTDSTSIHLTIGFVTPTWGEVLKEVVGDVVDELTRDPAFHGSLPPGFANANASMSEELGARLAGIAERIGRVDPDRAAERLARRFWADRSPSLSGQLKQIIDLPELSNASVVRRRPVSIARLYEAGGTLTLVVGDRSLQMPAKLKDALGFVLSRQSFTVSELSPYLDTAGQLVFTRRLIREGLLVQA